MNKDEILQYLNNANVGNINLMEICGTHTHAIARAGIKSMLPPNIKLLSGPGCPVCVTTEETIDAYLDLSMKDNLIIATYGDMIRVPGSKMGDNLATRRSLGANVAVVYSPIDAIDIAVNNPDKEVVFLGVGFETTSPGTAASIKVAKERNVKNYSVFSMLKKVEPALRTLKSDPAFCVQGFIVPGHVAVIIGEEGFKYLESDFHIPSVVAGFEPEDIWISIFMLAKQIESSKYKLENSYGRVVNPEGNKLAIDMIDKYLEDRNDIWRGLGLIENSGLGIRDEYSDFDAEKKFNITIKPKSNKSICKCGEVIKGMLEPSLCPLFGTRCIPDDPVGPCMVSGEGACSAAYKYRGV